MACALSSSDVELSSSEAEAVFCVLCDNCEIEELIWFNPPVCSFVRIAQENTGVGRRVDGRGALICGGGRHRQVRLSHSPPHQKVARGVMRAKEAFHLAPERRGVGAFAGKQFVAGGAGRHFNGPGEHVFGAGGGFVHGARKPALTLASAPASASAKIVDPFCPKISLRIYEGPVAKTNWQNMNRKTNQGIL